MNISHELLLKNTKITCPSQNILLTTFLNIFNDFNVLGILYRLCSKLKI